MTKTQKIIEAFKKLYKQGVFLSDGDVIREGDICIDNGNCWKTGDTGRKVDNKQFLFDVYFRPNSAPEKPKKKYRILNDNEVIKAGDQGYRVATRAWHNIAGDSIGFTPARWLQVCQNPTVTRRFRRAV
jgi:hypothetical protein